MNSPHEHRSEVADSTSEVFEKLLSNLVFSIKQLKGDVSVWPPLLVVSDDPRRLTQVSKSTCQSAYK